MTDTLEYADAPTPDADAFALGIETASAGAITPGLAYGISSHIPNENTPAHWLTHRYGTGVDLNITGTATYQTAVRDWLTNAPGITELIEEDGYVHVTIGGPVNLTGCPKPAKKKAATDEALTE